MDQVKVYGFQGEGRSLCLTCAEKIYGASLELYVNARVIQIIGDKERSLFALKGRLCDECLNWIFPPEKIDGAWWLVDPDPLEHLPLLAPFADYLEKLHIDAVDLRNISTM